MNVVKSDLLEYAFMNYFHQLNEPMLTLKQLEAFCWIAELGSFDRAARKLNTTQSAISKRIKDLEAMSSAPLFDRKKRSARLTPRGEELLAVSEKMIRLSDQIREVMQVEELPVRRLLLGVTEMTALTWLPRLVSAVREAYPSVEIEPEVESSQTLFSRLRQGRIDMIVVPDAYRDTRLRSIPVGQVNMTWMCSSSLSIPHRAIPLAELEKWTLFAQDERSGSGLTYKRWLERIGVSMSWNVSSNSLIALMGLTVSGLGVGYLPREAAAPLLRTGQLRIVHTQPALPPVPYVAMLRRHHLSAYESFVLDALQNCCDFTIPIYEGVPVHQTDVSKT